jgi:hypothetical protein
MKIIIGSVISIVPYSPGMAWNWMHHAVGLQRLGHDVYYLEEVDPRWCVDSSGKPCRFEDSVNRRLFQSIMERFDFMDKACQVYNRGEVTSGLSLHALETVCQGADLLLNISGHVKLDLVLGNVRRRVYVDQDPVYTQLWLAEYGKDLNFGAHDAFLTVGLNIGTPHTHIPTGGVEWHHALPPVVLDYWPTAPGPAAGRFTTIASWNGFRDLCYRGEWYRSKEEEFKRFAGLPGQVNQEFEAALRRHGPEDEGVRLLRANGWVLTESSEINDLLAYQNYIARSRAEIGIAKNSYIKGRSGWFSDRTAHYLASGRPALVQSTGIERYLPTGVGLLSFNTMEEAIAGVERINADYQAHCRVAREIAEEYLDYRKVLPRMLEDCTAGKTTDQELNLTA